MIFITTRVIIMSIHLMKLCISTLYLLFPKINTFKNNPKNNDRIPYIEKHSMIFVVKITDNLRVLFYFNGSKNINIIILK